MTDYQRLIDNIRSFLTSAIQVKSAQVVELSEEYARACTDANDRLRRCLDYLQKGLRTEAIHAAEEQPNLLDLVALLDLPEIDAWRAICFQYELADAPELAMESAAALNDAYAEGESAQAMLTRHRLLALAGAPLRDRLNTIRRLAESDSSAPFWDEDLRTFERARLEEIRTTVPQLAKGGNVIAAQHLHDELNSGSWRTAVPAELKTRAHDLAARLRGADAEARLRALLPGLNDAYSAMSFAESQSLLGQWDAIAAESGVGVPAELQEQIEPIVAWVAEQQSAADQQAAFDAACTDLEQALDVDATDATLERKYLTAVRFRLAMREELEDRYHRRLAARASARRNKRILMLTGIVAFTLIFAAAVGAMMFQSMRNREISDVQTALQAGLQDVDAGNADRAAAAMKQLLAEHPRIAGNPGILKAAADLHSAIDAEHQRVADFQRHLTAAMADGVERPNLAELQLAEPLAKLDPERTQMAAVKSQIDDYRGSQQRGRDEQFVARGKALTDSIDSSLTPELLRSDPAGFQKQLALFQGRAAELAKAAGVSPQLIETQIRSAAALLKQKQAGMDEAQAEQLLLDQLGASSSSDGQAAALKAYIEKFPQSVRSVAFRQTLDQVKEAQAIEAWELTSQPWLRWVPESDAEAASRLQRIGEYLKGFPSSPFAVQLGDYAVFLRLGQQTVGTDAAWKKTFRDLLNNPLVHDLRMVVTENGNRYYVLDDFKVTPSVENHKTIAQIFPAVTSSDVSKRTKITLRADENGKGMLTSVNAVPSPQAMFAAAAVEVIDRTSIANWDETGTAVIAGLMARSDINPVLQAILLQNALQADAPLLDWVGDTDYKAILDGLSKQGLDNLEWLDPDHQPAGTVISPLKNLFHELPPMQKIAAEIAKRRDAVFGAMPPSMKVAGVVLKEGNGFHVTAPADKGTSAYAIGGSSKVVQIARSDGHAWKVDVTKANEITDGALVFVGTSPN